MKTVFDANTWKKIGQPDIGCKMFLKRGKKKIWGIVESINYGHKKGVEISISPCSRPKTKNP